MGLDLTIHPLVYHETYIENSKYLADIFITEKLSDKYLLEIGRTSGLISIFAAKKGSFVSVLLDDDSVLNVLNSNFKLNDSEISCIAKSIDQITIQQKQDFIIVNPPHFNSNTEEWEKFSWHFTDNYEYFKILFENIKRIMHSRSIAWLPLDKSSPFDVYKIIATKNGLNMELTGERNLFVNDILMFKIMLIHN